MWLHTTIVHEPSINHSWHEGRELFMKYTSSMFMKILYLIAKFLQYINCFVGMTLFDPLAHHVIIAVVSCDQKDKTA